MISLVLPTRRRPGGFAEMVKSAAATATSDDVEVVAYIDDDDPLAGAYRKALYEVPTRFVVGPRCTLSDTWNRAAESADGEILMLAADDLRFRTPGWDLTVHVCMKALFPDGVGVIYGRDGHADRRMATHPFVGRPWVEIVGRFTTPDFCADYVDLWIHDVATRVDRLAYLPGVLVEHMHPAFGKGEWDKTHEERMSRAAEAGLPQLWEELEPVRAAEAARLVDALGVENL